MAMRQNLRTLKPHFGGVQMYMYAGVLVGVRHYSADTVGRTKQGTTLKQYWDSIN